MSTTAGGASPSTCAASVFSSCAPQHFHHVQGPKCTMAKEHRPSTGNILLVGDSNDRNALFAACAPRHTKAVYTAGVGFVAQNVDYDQIYSREPFFDCANRPGHMFDCRSCVRNGVWWVNFFISGLPLHTSADPAAPAAMSAKTTVEDAIQAFLLAAAQRGGPALIIGQSLIWDLANWAGCQQWPNPQILVDSPFVEQWHRAAAKLIAVLRNASGSGAVVACALQSPNNALFASSLCSRPAYSDPACSPLTRSKPFSTWAGKGLMPIGTVSAGAGAVAGPAELRFRVRQGGSPLHIYHILTTHFFTGGAPLTSTACRRGASRRARRTHAWIIWRESTLRGRAATRSATCQRRKSRAVCEPQCQRARARLRC